MAKEVVYKLFFTNFIVINVLFRGNDVCLKLTLNDKCLDFGAKTFITNSEFFIGMGRY